MALRGVAFQSMTASAWLTWWARKSTVTAGRGGGGGGAGGGGGRGGRGGGGRGMKPLRCQLSTISPSGAIGGRVKRKRAAIPQMKGSYVPRRWARRASTSGVS